MKNNQSPTVVVLGAKGMLGRVVYRFFKRKCPQTTWGTDRTDRNFLKFNALNPDIYFDNIKKKLKKIDFFINCIGILKKDFTNDKSALRKAVIVNSVFPHKLAFWAEKHGSRVIHISTDAVFPSLSKAVCEKDKPLPDDLYGASKCLGELTSPHSLTIRTSIIGLDPIEHKGLLEWILKNKQEKIAGYSNQNWSGCTVLQFAELCYYLTSKNLFNKLRDKTPIYHFAPLKNLAKYKIVSEFLKAAGIKNKALKKNGEKITRKLYSIYDNLLPRNIRLGRIHTALKELIAFER